MLHPICKNSEMYLFIYLTVSSHNTEHFPVCVIECKYHSEPNLPVVPMLFAMITAISGVPGLKIEQTSTLRKNSESANHNSLKSLLDCVLNPKWV